jgi:hypothetical protein
VVGGFRAVIERNGEDALEVGHIHYCGRAAAECLERADPIPAPEVSTVTVSAGGESVTVTGEQLARAAVALRGKSTFKDEVRDFLQEAVGAESVEEL